MVVIDRMSLLDVKGDVKGLEKDEVDKLHLLSIDVMALYKLRSSIQWKKSKINWLTIGMILSCALPTSSLKSN